MKVIYRICDIQSPLSQPSPFHYDTRVELNKVCLKSFVKAFLETEIEIHFLIDNSTDIWEEFIKEEVPFKYEITRTNEGIDATARRAVNLAKELDDDIMFQECDYLWLPETGWQYIEAIEELGFVSPYDHLDKYPASSAKISLCANRHWRTAISTTQTYGVTKENLNKYFEIISKHGYIDHAMWVELGEHGAELWTPIPSLATHCVTGLLAPSIDWFANLG